MLLAQIIVNGILLGGLYGLMALGMALVWGVLNIVNLAHGAFIMLGGYATYYLFTLAGLDPFVALPLAMLIMFGFGYLVQITILNQIIRSAQLNTLLITFGLDVVLTYLALLAFSADFRTINPSYAGANVTVLGVTIPLARLAAFAIAWVLAAALWFVLVAPAARPRHPRDGAEPHRGAALRGQPAAGLRADLRHRRGARRRRRRPLRPDLAPDALCRRQPDRQVLRHRRDRRPRQSVRGDPRRPRHRRRRVARLPLSRPDLFRRHQLRPAGRSSWSCVRPGR